MNASQLRTLRALRTLTEREQYLPSIADLAVEAGVSKTRVHQNITALRSAGLVTWEPRKVRTLRLTHAGTDAVLASKEAS